MASTKSNEQNRTKHAEQRDATYIQNKLCFVFLEVFPILFFYLGFLK